MKLVAVLVTATAAAGQITGDSLELDHPAITYRQQASTDRVAQLNRRLQTGESRLVFDERTGYLRSLLASLEVPLESQMMVFSKTSLQQRLIDPLNPRAIFF